MTHEAIKALEIMKAAAEYKTLLTAKEIAIVIEALTRIAELKAKPRPRLSMEMLASLEETWEAMEAVGEDPRDAAALRALLDWHYAFTSLKTKEPT